MRVLVCLLSFLCIFKEAYGKQFADPQRNAPVFFQADQVSYNETDEIMTLEGNVEASDGKDVLRADYVTYNKKTDQLHARGNVRLYSDKKDILETSEMNITGDLKTALTAELQILSHEDARLAGTKGEKNGNFTTVYQGVYSPCKLCSIDERAPTTWAIKAERIIRDEEAGEIGYDHARFEFLGISLFYLPAFRHVDPSVDRRSGLMPFELGFSSDYGMMVGIPYYLTFSPQTDLTVTAYPTTTGGVFANTNFRHRGSHSMTEWFVGGGYTDNKLDKTPDRRQYKKRFRGHIFGNGVVNLNDHWRVNYQLQQAENVAYLQNYSFLDTPGVGSKSFLTSFLQGEGFYGSDYISIQALTFDDLRTTANPALTPTIFPLIHYARVGSPGTWGEYWTWDVNELYLTRDSGSLQRDINGAEIFAKAPSMNRIGSRIGFHVPWDTDDGSLWKLTTSLESTLYSVDNFQRTNKTQKVSGSYGQALPQLGLFWRKPYWSYEKEAQWILEPKASLIVGPSMGNSSRIPNTDSEDFELNEGNLFSMSRFPGWDLLDGGSRFNYGVNLSYLRQEALIAKFFLGQSYSFTEFTAFINGKNKGIFKGFSDYILGLMVNVTPYVVLSTNMMLNRDTFVPRRTEIDLTVGPSDLQLKARYIYSKDPFVDDTKANIRNQLVFGGVYKFHENWQVGATMTYDFGNDPGALNYTTTMNYMNDCFNFGISYTRTYHKTPQQPSDTFMFTFYFKNLGTYATTPLGGHSTASHKLFEGK